MRQWRHSVCARAVQQAHHNEAEEHRELLEDEQLLVLGGCAETDSGSGAEESEAPFFGLALPEQRHQRQLDYKTIKALRAVSNTAAKDKTLVYIQVGQQGVTQTFLSACMDILAKHEYVRVKLGDGCGLERKQTAQALEQLLDCVCVHQIGYTITLYRQAGLPRPSNCLIKLQVVPAPAGKQDGTTSGSKDGPAASNALGLRAKKGRAQQQQRKGPPSPPEFEVLAPATAA